MTLAQFSIAPWDSGFVVTAREYNLDWRTIAGHLWIILLVDSENPEVIGHLSEIPENQNRESAFSPAIAVYHDYIYTSRDGFWGGNSYIISIADPENPEIISVNQNDPFESPLVIEGSLLFTGGRIFDLSDPTHPNQLSRFTNDDCLCQSDVQHDLVTIISTQSPQFRVYDARNPEEPEFVAGIDVFDYPYSMIIDNGYIYITEGSGIQILQCTGISNVHSGNYKPLADYELCEPYPNPFNSFTNICYNLSKQTFVRLTVYDITGREIRRLVEEDVSVGQHTYSFNSDGLATGLYIVQLQAGGVELNQKMVLVK
ncbi:T9SS type A sorting domain-containing protein [bacterium]|nr:T9SS type A sorting domain-containing protein [bacterium]